MVAHSFERVRAKLSEFYWSFQAEPEHSLCWGESHSIPQGFKFLTDSERVMAGGLLKVVNVMNFCW